MAQMSWLISAQLACACLLVCLYCAVASPAHAHAQKVRRSTGWSDCSEVCGGGSRSDGQYSVVCHVFGCNFQPMCTCGEADIVFIVDRSGSIGQANYWQQKQFMIDLVTGLDRVGDAQTKNTRVAVVSFGSDSTIEFDFNAGHTLNDLQSLVNVIWALPYLGGSTNTAAGLRTAAEIMATQGRVGPKRIGVLLADGGSNVDKDQTIPMANQLKATGAFLYSIGIGTAAEAELRDIASQPSDLFYFYAASYGSLDTIIEEVLNGSCCYSTETSCVSTGYSTCSASCGGGTRTSTDTCTYTNYFGDVITTETTTSTESCCSGPCSPDESDCARCDYTSGVGYLPDDNNCQCFYQCQPVGSSYIIHHMCCAPGLYWAHSVRTCGWTAEGTCRMPGATGGQGDGEDCPATETTTTTTQATPVPSACPYTANQANPAQFMYNGNLMGTCTAGLIWNVVDCACTGQATSAACDSGILLHFPFDDHLDDVSCNMATSDNHGNVELQSTSGHKGGAAYFNGTNFLSVQFLNNWFAGKNIQAWTMSLWIKPSGSGGFAGLVNNGDCEDEPSVSVFQTTGGQVSAGVDTATAVLLKLNNHGISPNQWTHVAMVYSGWQLTFYVDGQRQSTSLSVSGSIENRHCPLNIGRESLGGSTSSGYFSGYMDEVRIYDKVLSDWDIQQLYNNP